MDKVTAICRAYKNVFVSNDLRSRDYRILQIEALKKHDHGQKLSFEVELEAGTEEPRKQEFAFTIITTERDVEEKGFSA